MINLKKTTIALLMALSLMMASLTACSDDTKVISNNGSNNASDANTTDSGDSNNANSGDSQNGDSSDNNSGDSNSSTSYAFEYNGIKMVCDSDTAPIVEALGEPDSYFEEPSCAAEGIGKYYTYSDFEIDTYPDGDNDLIMYIILRTDNVKTPEGIDLSSTKDDVLNAYGDNYKETPSGVMYSDGTTVLSFFFDGDGYVSSIQYAAASVMD